MLPANLGQINSIHSRRLYYAHSSCVNLGSRFCIPVALRRHEANLESLRVRAMRWGAKDAQQNSHKISGRSIVQEALTPADWCFVTKTALHAIRALGLLFMIAGIGSIIAGLEVPAIALFVAGAAGLILGFALDKGQGERIQMQNPPSMEPLYEPTSEVLEEVRAVPAVTIPAIAFGKEAWTQHIGVDPGQEPPLPDRIHEILAEVCPFWSNKTVAQTHILVLIPKTVTKGVGEASITIPLTLKTLNELLKSSNNGEGLGYRYIWDKILEKHGDTPIQESHWVLMTNDVLPRSRRKNYLAQTDLVKAKGYEVPNCLDALAAILLENIRSGTRFFSGGTFTRCQENVDDKIPVMVGDFTSDGLNITNGFHDNEKRGIAGQKKF